MLLFTPCHQNAFLPIADCAKFQVIPMYIANIQHNEYCRANYELMRCKCGINWDKSYKIHALIEILHIWLAAHGLGCEQ